MKNIVIGFVKKEIVFVVALVASFISAFFVPPSIKYLEYINFRVLFILFSLMTVVAGLQACGVFVKCTEFICSRMHNLRSIAFSLVASCFFFSMLITNDVSLLTFVPFTLLIMAKLNAERYTAYVVVLETIAANLGSMFTPVGNPQNLFLFTQMNISAWNFCKILLPYSALSFLMLIFLILFIPSKKIDLLNEENDFNKGKDSASLIKKHFSSKKNQLHILIYVLLFIASLACVIHIIEAWTAALVTLICVLVIDRKLLLKVDYMLLLTFCAFFVFTGNIGNIETIKLFLENIVQKSEFLTGLCASQIISNVPAALLLEPFAINKSHLLLGVNVGGLGTLVASLASLISYKLYSNSETSTKKGGNYLLIFTALNVLCLIPLCLLFVILA